MWRLCLFILIASISLSGCAGNYNPSVRGSVVNSFMEVNSDEIGYLYELFATSNNFTKDQLTILNQSRYTIEAIIEHMAFLDQTGGVSYQDFKANISLASSRYYLMKPILKSEISRLNDREARIIYKNMEVRAEFFLSECNRIITDAEDDIDAKGFDNLATYGKGFYNALAPLIDMAL
ncbi:hypothetical protein KAU11_08375 [Candidatus Babeliales bacterium]|nr:hypothetical protein [Candidatus Babeliales bacterium]